MPAVRTIPAIHFDWTAAGALSLNSGAVRVMPSTNRVLINTSVDSGALLQIGTNTTTASGGLSFGTDLYIYRGGPKSLVIAPNLSPSAIITDTIAAFYTPLRLHNAYVAGVGAATGYLTVQDANGTTYKVPVLA